MHECTPAHAQACICTHIDRWAYAWHACAQAIIKREIRRSLLPGSLDPINSGQVSLTHLNSMSIQMSIRHVHTLSDSVRFRASYWPCADTMRVHTCTHAHARACTCTHTSAWAHAYANKERFLCSRHGCTYTCVCPCVAQTWVCRNI